ncbi:MAG: signal peptidase I [Actinomycetota bacterium]|nr:signal peptidase I [Actinomycetota bacterium]
MRFVRETAVLIGTAIVIAFLVKTFVAQAFYIPSGSMLPQLQINDRVVVSKLAYRLHDPRRGDIVVFDEPGRRPTDDASLPRKVVRGLLQSVGLAAPSTDEYIKRVVALPGERVEGKGGHVYVNGRRVVEPYLPAGRTTDDFPSRVVEDGRLWVMGDNRANSSDSRTFGTIPESDVVGRAVVRLWPLSTSAFL